MSNNLSERESQSTPSAKPLVSVVIPTRNRASLLRRALSSVQKQSYPNLEVIVVVDGPDQETTSLIEECGDSFGFPLRQVVNEVPLGCGGARNVGVRQAQGDWVAFLDDDDEWLPEKIDRQVEAALKSEQRSPFVYTQVAVCDGVNEKVWPQRGLRSGEDVGEYLCAKKNLQDGPDGEGLMLPSSWLLSRSIMADFPFDPELKCHEDLDWLLRVGTRLPVGFIFIAEPLAVWHLERDDQTHLSFGERWREALAFGRERKALMSRRAYAGWLLGRVSDYASATGEHSALPRIAYEAVKEGRPGPFDVLGFLKHAVLQRGLRKRLLTWATARSRGNPPSNSSAACAWIVFLSTFSSLPL